MQYDQKRRKCGSRGPKPLVPGKKTHVVIVLYGGVVDSVEVNRTKKGAAKTERAWKKEEKARPDKIDVYSDDVELKE